MMKAKRVLRFIGKQKNGATLKEIQTFVLQMNGIIGKKEQRPRSKRGYWYDYLMGNHIRNGILPVFCFKNEIGRWELSAWRTIMPPFSKTIYNKGCGEKDCSTCLQ